VGAELIFTPNMQFKINYIGVEILELMNGGQSIENIISNLANKYNDSLDHVRGVVLRYIKLATDQGYIHISEKPSKIKILFSGSRENWIPKSVSLEVTNSCNLRCKHCYADAGNKSEKERDITELMELLKKLRTMGVKNLNVTGGEPLTYDRIFDILDYAYTTFNTSLLTNGYSIDAEMAKKLSKYSGMSIQISVDGSNSETHDYIRGVKGAFQNAINAIELLSKSGMKVFVSSIITPFNLDEVEDILNLVKQKGAVRYRVGVVIPAGRARDLHWDLSEEEGEKLRYKIKQLKEKYEREIFVDSCDIATDDERKAVEEKIKNCGAGYSLVVIDPNGNVRPCSHLPADIFNQGNIFKDGEKVFASKMSHFLFDIQTPRISGCTECEKKNHCAFCLATAYYTASQKSCKWIKNLTADLNTCYGRQ
jgi:radical SAM protein with 4Fe4S-binding SPASM domain